jgi:hypothetical protein
MCWGNVLGKCAGEVCGEMCWENCWGRYERCVGKFEKCEHLRKYSNISFRNCKCTRIRNFVPDEGRGVEEGTWCECQV